MTAPGAAEAPGPRWASWASTLRHTGAGHVGLNLATPRPVLTSLVARMAAAVRAR